MSSDSKPRFSSILKSSAASRKGLGDDLSEVSTEPVVLDVSPVPVKAAPSAFTSSNSVADEQHGGADLEEGKRRSDKATWKPLSTRANPILMKAVNRQLLEEERNFTDLIDELLTKWLHEKTGS
jgi:hypothetical protein